MTMQNRSAKPAGAVTLVGTLVAIYMVSQFLRNSVGVIAPDLATEVGLNAAELGLLSSAFFFAFASAQLPLGVALDRFGPRLSLLVGAAITVVGVVVFALATTPTGLIGARVLLGLGCASSLMAPLALYARVFPPERFATLTGLQLGLGTTGTVLATAPLAWSAAAIGWRDSFLAVAAITLTIAVLVALVVRNPPEDAAHVRKESFGDSIAGLMAVVRTPFVGSLFLMQLAGYSSFALVLGLWGGPYLTHVYGYGLKARGNLLLIGAAAQIVGSLAWGPMDRVFASFKRPILLGALASAAALGVLAAAETLPTAMLIAWFAVFGVACAYLPVLIAHGRALFPHHLVGRGITLLNIGSMGGVFLSQTVSGAVINLFPAPGGVYPLDAYRVVFALQALFLLAACAVYLGVRDAYAAPKPA